MPQNENEHLHRCQTLWKMRYVMLCGNGLPRQIKKIERFASDRHTQMKCCMYVHQVKTHNKVSWIHTLTTTGSHPFSMYFFYFGAIFYEFCCHFRTSYFNRFISEI